MTSKTCVSRIAMLIALVVAVSNSGCGGASSSPPPPVAPTDITGAWSIIVTDTANNTTAVFANISSQGGGNFFATGANTMTCDLTTVQCQITDTPNLTIQISQSNHVSLTMSNLIDENTGTTDTISADGTVDSAYMSGSWISQGGVEHGTWQGQRTFNFTDLYSGTINSTLSPSPIPVGVSLSVTQDASYNLTASATFSNSPCFTSLSFSGHVVGGAFYMTDSTSSIVVYGIGGSAFSVILSRPLQFGYKILSGCDSGDQGQGTLSTKATPIK
jgi:hypothetical protein